jgi:hypothetical protein
MMIQFEFFEGPDERVVECEGKERRIFPHRAKTISHTTLASFVNLSLSNQIKNMRCICCCWQSFNLLFEIEINLPPRCCDTGESNSHVNSWVTNIG